MTRKFGGRFVLAVVAVTTFFCTSAAQVATASNSLAPQQVAAQASAGATAAGAAVNAAATDYPSTVLADSPSMYLRLDDAAGATAADTSGNHVSATYGDGVTRVSGGALTGDTDQAASTDAPSPVVQVAPNDLPARTGDWTAEFWFKSSSSSGYTPILTYGGVILYLQDSSNVVIRGTSDAQLALPYRLDDGAWHLWDLQLAGGTATLLLDGQSLGSGPVAPQPAAGFTLGNWAGQYDEVSLYSSALTRTQVNAHWTAGASSGSSCSTPATGGYAGAVMADSPAAFYRLDERAADPSARVALDLSGACRNAAYSPFVKGASTGAVTGDTSGALTAPDDRPALRVDADSLPGGSSARTVEFWFKAAGPHTSTPVLQYGGLSLFLRDSGDLLIRSGNDLHLTLPSSVDDSTWHLWSLVATGSTASLYLDGQPLGSGALSLNATKAASLQLGAWAGDYDELAVYPTALPAARIVAHWTAGESTAPACAPTADGRYGTAVTADQPTVFYRLGDQTADAKSRVAFDSSGHCLNAALSPSATAGAGAVAGDPDGAATAPDARPILRAAAAALPVHNQPRTVEFWFRAAGSSDFTPTLQYGGMTFFMAADGDLLLRGTADVRYTLPYRVDDNTWHLWNVVYDGTTATVYLDGQPIGSNPFSLDTDGTGSLQFGAWAGDYDELAIYPTALPAARVNAHWTAGASRAADCAAKPAGRYGTVVVADQPTVYYRLGDQTIDPKSRVAFDSSGHCLNAALSPYATPGPGVVTGDPDGAATAPDTRPILRAAAAPLPVHSQPRTVEFWFRAAGPSDYTPTLQYGGLTLYLHDSGSVLLRGATDVRYTLPARVDDKAWHLWNVVYDGTQATVYLDGTSLGSQDFSVDTNGTGSLQLGAWAGDYDELAVYPTALSPERVNLHWVRAFKGPVTPTIAVSADPASVSFGSPVTITASLTAGDAPTGTVEFSEAGRVLGSEPVNDAGQATVTLASFGGGGHTVTAVYSGDTRNESVQGATDVTVVPAATTTALTSSANPAQAGNPVTLTATTTSPAGTPAGTVTFTDGDTTLGSATLISGQATLTTTALAAGTHTITVRYGGSDDHASSTASLTQTITPAPPASAQLDATVSVNHTSTSSNVVTPNLRTTGPGRLLLAFLSADGPSSTVQRASTVTGGGLTWQLVRRAGSGYGTAEIWQTYATTAFNAPVTATLAVSGRHAALTVAAFSGARSTVGASAASTGYSADPTVSLTTTAPGSLVWAAGHDWTDAASRTPLTGQVMVNQFVDTSVHDTYWTQRTLNPVAASATTVVSGVQPGTRDRWQLAAVEIMAAP